MASVGGAGSSQVPILMKRMTPNHDAELETRIWLAYYKAIDSKKSEDWSAFTSLVRQRRPERVSAMEKRLGLS